MWVALALGRSGWIVIGSCIRSHRSGVTLPVTSVPVRPTTSFWYAHTAAWVAGPNWPSTGPGSNAMSTSRCWRRVTSSPTSPVTSVRSRGTLATDGAGSVATAAWATGAADAEVLDAEGA